MLVTHDSRHTYFSNVNIKMLLNCPQYPLGSFHEECFEEEVPCKLMTKFKEDLKSLSGLIKKRNAKLELPYTFLDPDYVDNSVAI